MTEEEKESFEDETSPSSASEPEAESTLEVDRSVLKPAAEPVAERDAEEVIEPTATHAEPEATGTAAAPAAATPVERKPVPWALYTRLTGFVSMLVLAIVGMYFINTEYSYVWLYWVVVVMIFMVVSFFRGYQGSKERGETLGSALSRYFMHWGGLIIVVGIMMVLENNGKIETDVAANILLLLLALTCYLAGVHFDPLFMVIGAFLAVITLLLTLESQGIVWAVSILAAVLALGIGFFYFRSKAKTDEEA